MVQQLLEDSRRHRAEIQKRIMAANPAWEERIDREGMTLSYAPDIDHLYMTIGRPRTSLSIPGGDPMRVVVLYDPDTYEVTAMEIPAFMEKVERGLDKGLWAELAGIIREHGDTIYFPADQEKQRTERVFREIVLA